MVGEEVCFDLCDLACSDSSVSRARPKTGIGSGWLGAEKCNSFNISIYTYLRIQA